MEFCQNLVSEYWQILRLSITQCLESRQNISILIKSSAQDPDPLDPQHFDFLDPDPDPKGKISTKTVKKMFDLSSYIIKISNNKKKVIIKII